MPPARSLATCFAIGALVGTALDGIHLLGDVLSYETESFGDWAWFVPIEFGLAGVAAGIAIPRIERAVGPPVFPPLGVARRAAELLLFAAAYGVTALWDGDGAPWVTAGLLGLLAVRLVLAPLRGDAVYALGAAVLGPLGEIAILGTGAFDYAHPDFAGIPMWLPALWANGGLLIRRLLAPVVLPVVALHAQATGALRRTSL